MTALIVVLAILLFFFLIGQIRVGGLVEYSETGILAKIKLGPFWYTVYPMEKKEKPEKPKKEKKKKPPKPKKEKPKKKPEEEPPKKKGGTLELIRKLIPLATEAAGKFFRKLRVDELTLHLTWASGDPAQTAMGYGAANAAVGAILHPLERAFRIKKRDIRIGFDFQGSAPVVYVRAALTITVGQIFTLGLYYGAKALAAFLKWRGARARTDKKDKKEATVNE